MSLGDRKDAIYPGIHDELSAFLENEKSPLLAKGLDLAKQVGMKLSPKLLVAQALNGKTEMATRVAALRALSASEEDFKAALPDLMKLPEDQIQATLLDLHFKLKLDGREALAEAALVSKSPERVRVAIRRLIEADGAGARFEKLWNDRATALPAATHLDLHLAMRASNQEALKKLAEAFAADPKNVQGLALEGGNAVKGELVFRGAGACTQCHSVDGQGGIQGPPLDGVALRQDRVTLLESVITPNAKIADGYGTMTITTKSGETVMGQLKAEKDGKVELLLPSGEKKAIAAGDIVKREGPISIMPQIAAVLPPTDLRDLIEFLSQRKAKGAPKNAAEHGDH